MSATSDKVDPRESERIEPKGYLPPASDAREADVATVTPEEGQRNLRWLMFKIGAVLIGMHLLFLGAFIGMGASFIGGLHTAQVEIKQSIIYYSWDELASISREIAASGSDAQALRVAQRFHLVDPAGLPFGARRVALSDGTLLTARLVALRSELPTGTGGLTFILEGELDPRAMDDTIAQSWDSTQLRSWLNEELLEMLPLDLKRTVKLVAKPASADALRTTSDRLWLASVPELGEEVPGDGLAALPFLAEGALAQGWLRSPASDGAGFCYVDGDGQVVLEGELCDASERRAVIPFFVI